MGMNIEVLTLLFISSESLYCWSDIFITSQPLTSQEKKSNALPTPVLDY